MNRFRSVLTVRRGFRCYMLDNKWLVLVASQTTSCDSLLLSFAMDAGDYIFLELIVHEFRGTFNGEPRPTHSRRCKPLFWRQDACMIMEPNGCICSGD